MLHRLVDLEEKPDQIHSGLTRHLREKVSFPLHLEKVTRQNLAGSISNHKERN